MIEIIASDIENPENKQGTDTKVIGGFPGVVCFYRSKDQRMCKYGKEESSGAIPSFAFDTYIPRLYGVDSNILKSYQTSSDIVTALEVQTGKNKSKGIMLYPNEEELVYGSKKTDFDISGNNQKQEKKYFIPWLYIQDTQIRLYINVLFCSGLHKTDDFMVYKNGVNIETIGFKLVKVDNDWEPIKHIEESKEVQRYVEITEVRALTEAQKSRREAMTQQKDELEKEEAELKEAQEKWEADNNDYESRKTKRSERRTELNTRINKYKVDYDYYSLRAKEHKGEATPDEIKQLRADQTKYKSFDFTKESNRLNKESKDIDTEESNLETEKKDIEKLKIDLNKLKSENDVQKITLETKRKSYEKEKNEIEMEDRLSEVDDTLTLSKITFDYDFKAPVPAPPGASPAHTTLAIQRSGNNKKAALIAYYTRPDKGVDKEYIVGQVNILDYEFYKGIGVDAANVFSNVEKIYFNPLPVHLVQVMVRKDDKPAKESALPKTAKEMVDQFNPYFKLLNISFFSTQRTSKIEVELKKVDSKLQLIVDGAGFKMNDSEYLKETKNDSNIELKNQLDNLLRRYLMSNIFYDTTDDKGNVIGKFDLLKKHTYINEKDKEVDIPASGMYENLLDELPKLRPKDKKDSKAKWETALSLAEYLIRQNNVVYMIRDIAGEGSYSKQTRGYATVGSNGVVIFGKGLEDWTSTMIHELGHTLGLQHTFDVKYPMFPNKVSFDTDKWKNKITQKDKGDYLAYGATYDNIMDYEGIPDNSKAPSLHGTGQSIGINTSYIRRSFTRQQWMIMYKSLWWRSYEVATPGEYKGILSKLTPCLDTKEEIDTFVSKIKHFL